MSDLFYSLDTLWSSFLEVGLIDLIWSWSLAHIPLFLYPFLHTTSKTRPFEYLRLTSLGVVGALVKVLNISQHSCCLLSLNCMLMISCCFTDWWSRSYKFPPHNRDYSFMLENHGIWQWTLKNCKWCKFLRFNLTCNSFQSAHVHVNILELSDFPSFKVLY